MLVNGGLVDLFIYMLQLAKYFSEDYIPSPVSLAFTLRGRSGHLGEQSEVWYFGVLYTGELLLKTTVNN